MILANEQTNILFNIVNNSTLARAITGEVYKYAHPTLTADKPEKENVVVNTITLEGNRFQDQTGFANINIHVPSIKTADGVMPNLARFDELVGLVKEISEVHDGNLWFSMWIENSRLVKEISKEGWFFNIKVQFNFQHKY